MNYLVTGRSALATVTLALETSIRRAVKAQLQKHNVTATVLLCINQRVPVSYMFSMPANHLFFFNREEQEEGRLTAVALITAVLTVIVAVTHSPSF